MNRNVTLPVWYLLLIATLLVTFTFLSSRENTHHSAAAVVLADSTALLSFTEDSPCTSGPGSWPQLVGAENLACAGARSDKMRYTARFSPEIGTDTTQVLITIGSNSLRASQSPEEVTDNLTDTIDTINRRAPKASVALVEYLPISDISCLKGEDHTQMKALKDNHEQANTILEDVASSRHLTLVSLDHLDSGMCSDTPLVALTGTDEVDYHTNARGHELIADAVAEQANRVVAYDMKTS